MCTDLSHAGAGLPARGVCVAAWQASKVEDWQHAAAQTVQTVQRVARQVASSGGHDGKVRMAVRAGDSTPCIHSRRACPRSSSRAGVAGVNE